MNFILKYSFISIMENGPVNVLNVGIFIKDILDKNYQSDWKENAPLPPVLLCLCMEYIVDKEVCYHIPDATVSRCHTVDGKRHGEWKSWYYNPEVRLNSECTYVEGKLHGEWKTWANKEYKKLQIHGFYVNDKKEGEWTLFVQGTIHKDNYVNGKKHGECTQTYNSLNEFASGPLWIKETYKNGIKHGVYQTWSYSGQLEWEGYYVHGKRHGEWKARSKRGWQVYVYDNDVQVLSKWK